MDSIIQELWETLDWRERNNSTYCLLFRNFILPAEQINDVLGYRDFAVSCSLLLLFLLFMYRDN